MAHANRRTGISAPRARGEGLSARRGPNRLPGIVDSHAHLQHDRFDADRDEVIERAVAAGVHRILVPGWDVVSSEAALSLAERHPRTVQAAVGVHPHDAGATGETAWQHLEALAADDRCVAIGEIGLDFHRNLSTPDVQRAAFSRQLELAARLGKPVIVHDRDAHDEVTRALLAWTGRPRTAARGALHAFSGDAAMATDLVGGGFLISFALPVAFRSAAAARAAAAAIPSTALLVETDSPYLGPDRDARNEPPTVIRVAAELARIRGTDVEGVASGVRAAYERLTAVA